MRTGACVGVALICPRIGRRDSSTATQRSGRTRLRSPSPRLASLNGDPSSRRRQQPQPLTGLVDQYAAYATSDAVIGSLQKQGLLPRERRDEPRSGRDQRERRALAAQRPAHSPADDHGDGHITGRGDEADNRGRPDAFIDYARSRQKAEKIPKSQRVELRIVKRASVPTLTVPRSKTNFIIILLAGLTATVAAAFVRDNLQRAGRRKSQPEPVSTLDPFVREAEAPLLNGSEPVHGAAEHASRSGRSEVRG